MTSGKVDKLLCLLCRGMISLFVDKEEDRFLEHMKSQHDTYFNIEFLRAACKMDDDEKTAVIDVMKTKTVQYDNDEDENDVDSEVSGAKDECGERMPHSTNLKKDDDCPSTPSEQKDLSKNGKTVKQKIFICSINGCNKEFRTKFMDLANHKVNVHKLSKKESQVISMKHVRYESVFVNARLGAKNTPEKIVTAKIKTEKLDSVHIKKQNNIKPEPKEQHSACDQVKIKGEPIEDNHISQPKKDKSASRDCILCKLKISSEDKMKMHMKITHTVPEGKMYVFEDGGKGLFKVSDFPDPNIDSNQCKLCDISHQNLGLLWNHYKRQHKVGKDTIKGLITKTKCKICSAQVTFISEHNKAFHQGASASPSKAGEKIQSGSEGGGSTTAQSKSEQKLAMIWQSAIKHKTNDDKTDGFSKERPVATAVKSELVTTEKDSNNGSAATDTMVEQIQNIMRSGETLEAKHIQSIVKSSEGVQAKSSFSTSKAGQGPLKGQSPTNKNIFLNNRNKLKEEPLEEDEFYFCDDCDFSTNKEEDYQVHVKVKHASKERSVEEESPSKKRRIDKIHVSEENHDQADKDKDQYVAKLMDKLKDMDDSDDEDEDADDPGEEEAEKDARIEQLPDQDDVDQTDLIVTEQKLTHPTSNGMSTPPQNRLHHNNEIQERLQGLNLTKLTPALVTGLRSSAYFRAHPSSVAGPPDQTTAALFTADPQLGRGWRVRYFALAAAGGCGKIDREFLSPEGIRLRSSEAVIEYLLCGDSQDLVDSARAYLGVL